MKVRQGPHSALPPVIALLPMQRKRTSGSARVHLGRISSAGSLHASLVTLKFQHRLLSSSDDAILFTVYMSLTENQDAINTSIVGAPGVMGCALTTTKLLDFKPFNPVYKHTEITYGDEASGRLNRVTKGMIDYCPCYP